MCIKNVKMLIQTTGMKQDSGETQDAVTINCQ